MSPREQSATPTTRAASTLGRTAGISSIGATRLPGSVAAARTFDTVSSVDLIGRWWNGQRERTARRDIWLTSDGQRWHVRGRHGATEVDYDCTRGFEARAIVDRLIAAAPGGWKDI